MPINLTISVDDVHDHVTLGNLPIIESIFSQAEEVVKKGGKIIVQQEYANAEPDVLFVFKTMKEVVMWKEQIKG